MKCPFCQHEVTWTVDIMNTEIYLKCTICDALVVTSIVQPYEEE